MAVAAAPKASLSRPALTGGMLTRTVLAVAVRAIDTAEKAKHVGSSTMAAVPSPCALPPCARPRAAGSLTLVVAIAAAVAAAVVLMVVVVAMLAAVRVGINSNKWGGGGSGAAKSREMSYYITVMYGAAGTHLLKLRKEANAEAAS